MIPTIIGIIAVGVYGIFELLIRRKERIMVIENLGDKLDPSMIIGKLHLPSLSSQQSFGTIKAAGLISGIGLGLLIGFVLAQFALPEYDVRYLGNWDYTRRYDQIVAVVYGASVLLMGGLGLIVAFIVELKISKQTRNN